MRKRRRRRRGKKKKRRKREKGGRRKSKSKDRNERWGEGEREKETGKTNVKRQQVVQQNDSALVGGGHATKEVHDIVEDLTGVVPALSGGTIDARDARPVARSLPQQREAMHVAQRGLQVVPPKQQHTAALHIDRARLVPRRGRH